MSSTGDSRSVRGRSSARTSRAPTGKFTVRPSAASKRKVRIPRPVNKEHFTFTLSQEVDVQGISTAERAKKFVSVLLSVPVRERKDEVEIVITGCEPSTVDAFSKFDVSYADIDWVIPRRTLAHRKEKGARLTLDESDRTLRAAKLVSLANAVFGSVEKASSWLHKPRKAFEGENALSYMRTESGARIVEDMLNQIDSGYAA